MSENPDRALPAWILDRFGPEPTERLIGHPRFVDALKMSTLGALAHYEADRTISDILKDLGRFYVGVLCVYLHATPGGLTLSRLRTLCDQSQTISATAAEALLGYMRDIGFVEPVSAQPDRRALVLAPTAALWDNLRDRMRLEVAAAALLEPRLGPLLAAWEAPETFAAFMAVQGRDAVVIAGLDRGPPTGLGILFSRNAGPLLLMAIMAGAGPEDDFPPQGRLRLSMNALAQAFDVSRAHVARFVAAGEEAGYFERLGDGRELRFTPELREILRGFYARTYAQSIAAGLEAMGRLGLGEPPNSGGNLTESNRALL
ncbi:MAG TPA: hypothetical protein VEA44_18385 [Caulobacter sp.]|nr:hypothetical protein [Caulobacter sp.]